jgi:ankyrin repeat protein
LHSAALVGNIEVTKWLLNHGADLAVRDDSGETAYEVACRWHFDGVAKILAKFEGRKGKETFEA